MGYGHSCSLLRVLLPVLVLGCALIVPGGARGETWYTVEFVVFEHLSDDGLDAEVWPRYPGKPPIDGAIELTELSSMPDMEDELDLDFASGPHAFRLLKDKDLKLHGVWKALRGSRGFRPLLHLGWRQPGFGREESLAAYVRTPLPEAQRAEEFPTSPSGARPRKVEGVLRLYLSRYLHLQADLLYFRLGAFDGDLVSADPVMSPAGPGGQLRTVDLLPAGADPVFFRLVTSRRVRSGELHYFDHPLFGIITLVTPFEVETQPLEPPDSQDLEPVPELE